MRIAKSTLLVLAAALAALQQLEAALPGLIAFEIGERRGLPLMGPRS